MPLPKQVEHLFPVRPPRKEFDRFVQATRRPDLDRMRRLKAPPRDPAVDDAKSRRCATSALTILRPAPDHLSPKAYTRAAGYLKRVCKLTGETPRQVCDRLGIHGAHRTGLMPHGDDRFKLNGQEVQAYATYARWVKDRLKKEHP